MNDILEKTAGEGAGHTHETCCLNCGTRLIGPHCHNCGQHAHAHRTLGAFLHDLLHGALHFEGKIWHTLPQLVLHPGALTRRYINGERVRFVSPLALFLFAVFLMFAVFQMVGLTAPSDLRTPPQLQDNLGQALHDAATELEVRRRAVAVAPIGSVERAVAENELKNSQAALDTLRGSRKFVIGDNGNADLRVEGTGIDWIDKGIVEKWRKHPELMLYKMQSNSYKFSWLLIPLSLPFVWLLFFWRREFKAYDHAIFVTYSLAFMSLLFVVLSVMGVVGVSGAVIGLAAMLVPPLHIYKQLRGAYALSRGSALWRLLLMLFFVSVILLLFLQLLLVLGALG